MKHFFFFFLLLFITPLLCQKDNFVWALQSGVNHSSTLVTTEFGQTPFRRDFYIGSSFGIVARSKLFKYKWEWGNFSNYFNVYAEYGINYT